MNQKLSKPSPQMGSFIETTHYYPIRIYYENTDAGGIVYHADYLTFMERARTEFLRLLGFNQSLLSAEDSVFVVFNLSIDYKNSAKLDDEIVVKTQLSEIKMSYIVFHQDIISHEKIHSKSLVKVCCINNLGKPRRIPPRILNALHDIKKT